MGHATHLAIDMKRHSLKVHLLDKQHNRYHLRIQLRLLQNTIIPSPKRHRGWVSYITLAKIVIDNNRFYKL